MKKTLFCKVLTQEIFLSHIDNKFICKDDDVAHGRDDKDKIGMSTMMAMMATMAVMAVITYQ